MFTKLKPTRTAATATEETPANVKLVCDFDSLLSATVGFKFEGKTYIVNALDLENYMQVTLAYKNLTEMIQSRADGQVLTSDDVYQKYYDLVHPLCPTFSYESLKRLPFAMLNHLMNIMLRQVAGDPELFSKTDEKKNSLNPPPPLSKLISCL